MTVTNDDLLAIATTESTERTTEQELGLISGMLDDKIVTFEFRGLRVSSQSDAIVVSQPDTGARIGGEYAIDGADITEVHNWLTNKAKQSGPEQVMA